MQSALPSRLRRCATSICLKVSPISAQAQFARTSARITHHLKPHLGKKRVDAIERADIERLLTAVKAGKMAAPIAKTGKRQPGSVPTGGGGVAAQCVALASTIMKFAVDRKLRADNPARGIKKPPIRKMERFLSHDELFRLADALKADQERGGSVYAIAAIKLLALTGCRRGEILALRWQDVDLGRQILNLPQSKTREKKVFLSPPAAIVLSELPRVFGNDHVLPGSKEGTCVSGIDKAWWRIRKAAGVPGLRLHDLRHTFASFGASSGLGLPIVGKAARAYAGEHYAALRSSR